MRKVLPIFILINNKNENKFENDVTKDVKFDNTIKEKELHDQITVLKFELNKIKVPF